MTDLKVTAETILKNIGCKGKWNVNKKKAIDAIVIALLRPNPDKILNEVEQKAFDEFVEAKRKKNSSVKLILSYDSGIAPNKWVKVGKKKKDITDYSTW